MFKSNFIILKFKKMIISLLICLFILSLLLFSNTNLISAKNGLVLWVNTVVPSLLPFFIATELLGYTNIIFVFGKLIEKIMKPIFNVSGNSFFPFIMGLVSGYPVGAKVVSDLKLQGIITNVEAERLIAFTNNSGPLFILGTVGIGMFKNKTIGILLTATHVLACLSTGFIFRWWKIGEQKIKYKNMERTHIPSKKIISITNLGEIISTSIMNAINIVLMIGGFIVLFSVILSILENSGILTFFSNLLIPFLSILGIPAYYATGLISGVFEITNGISKIASIPSKSTSTNIIICAFLLGFGGVCVCLQILSIISKAKISIKPYLIGKLLQGILAAVYTYLFIHFIPIFNL